MNLDRRFYLTVEETEKILQQCIEPKYHIPYTVRKSPISNSVYVIFYGSAGEKIVRLSDHEHGYLPYNYISKRTKRRKVVGILEKALRDLNTLCVHRKLNEMCDNANTSKDNYQMEAGV